VNRSEYTSANRRGWNQAAPVHRASQFETLRERFAAPGYSCLDDLATSILTETIGVEGKAVVQLCCNNGRELLSVKNLGASRCVGFDIADAFIAQGRELATAGRLDAELVASDIYAIPHEYDGTFDVAFSTIGALGWLPDLTGAFAVCARLLQAGGAFFIYDEHPFLGMFEGDDAPPPSLRYSYFDKGPHRSDDGLDYFEFASYESDPVYWFQHTVSDILTACLDNGLALEHFREYEHDIANVYRGFERQREQLPLCFTLIARQTK